MMKHEFEQRIGREISHEDYEKVQTVYTYYPAKGLDKDKVAEMYQIFGMRVFDDMLPRAQKVGEGEVEKEVTICQGGRSQRGSSPISKTSCIGSKKNAEDECQKTAIGLDKEGKYRCYKSQKKEG